MSRLLVMCLVPAVLLSAVASAPGVTDSEVVQACEKARAYLIKQQLPSGLWPEDKAAENAGTYGTSEAVLAALAYVGEHPNRDFMSNAIGAGLQRRLDTTYAVSMRAMVYSFLMVKVIGGDAAKSARPSG